MHTQLIQWVLLNQHICMCACIVHTYVSSHVYTQESVPIAYKRTKWDKMHAKYKSACQVGGFYCIHFQSVWSTET